MELYRHTTTEIVAVNFAGVLSIGYVSLIGFVVMAPASSYVAGFGARLAHNMPQRRLEIAFGLFLAVMAVRFTFASIL